MTVENRSAEQKLLVTVAVTVVVLMCKFCVSVVFITEMMDCGRHCWYSAVCSHVRHTNTPAADVLLTFIIAELILRQKSWHFEVPATLVGVAASCHFWVVKCKDQIQFRVTPVCIYFQVDPKVDHVDRLSQSCIYRAGLSALLSFLCLIATWQLSAVRFEKK